MTFSRNDTAAAKAVAIILMLVHHLFGFKSRLGDGMQYIPMFSSDVEYIAGGFGKLCVAIFIFMSGFGTYLALNGKDHVLKRIVKKIFGLYKKYWAVFFVFIPVGMLLGVERIEVSAKAFFLNLFAVDTSYNGEWWFITPFIIITLVSPLIIKFADRKWLSKWWVDLPLALVVSLFATRAVLRVLDIPLIDPFFETPLGSGIEEAIEFFPAFFMGVVVAKHKLFDKFLTLVKKVYVAIPVGLALCVLVFVLRRQYGADYDYIFSGIFVIGAVAVVRYIKPVYAILGEIGSVSTEIWLIHTFFCYHFIPKIIYAPKNAVLITLWLLLISYIAGKALVLATVQTEKLISKTKAKIKSTKADKSV